MIWQVATEDKKEELSSLINDVPEGYLVAIDIAWCFTLYFHPDYN